MEHLPSFRSVCSSRVAVETGNSNSAQSLESLANGKPKGFTPVCFFVSISSRKNSPQLHVVSAMCTPTDRLMGQVFTGVNVTSILLKPHVLARALGTVAIVMSGAVRSVWAMAVASARTRLSATGGPQCRQNRASRGSLEA